MDNAAGTIDILPTSGPWPDQLADALGRMAVPALVTNRDGVVVHANASVVKALELPAAGWRQPLRDLLASWQGVDRLEAALKGTAADAVRISSGLRLLDCAVRPLEQGGVVITLQDVSGHARAVEDAKRDALTGLLDRSSLRARLEAALAESGEPGWALLCVDLDRFKAVNDTLGHPVGDALLRKIADRLRRATRACDVVARLGGDEFAVLQGQAPAPDAAEVLAKRLIDLLGRTYVIDGHMLNVGASIGVAYLHADGKDAETLLRNADLALYQAKAGGRGTYRVFDSSMDDRLQARRALELDLRRALAFKEFELAYQPQVYAADGKVSGFEALIRWRHPRRGMVSPGDFIPLAEEIGLMPAIGEWVLRTACKEAAGWSVPVSIAVNLSPVQFRSPKLAETVISALQSSGLPASRLELEITEGALLENTDAVVGILGRLADLGVRTSMDDFGTGYSSLSYLQKFRFDKIKIDQSFVRQVGVRADSTAIVRAVAALGASLGMKTTAEGVETAEQLEQIRLEGCTEIQGYLTGRPMTGAAAASLLAAIQDENMEGVNT